jgi:hypothetical protein
MEQRRHDRRAGRARAAALAAALAALVGAGEAVAGDVLVPELATSESPGPALEQAAEQAGQTLQTAGSGAATVQEGASNVALSPVEASQGAQTVVTQANDTNAVSEAANGAQTTQVAGQGQQGELAVAPDLPPPAEADQAPAEVNQAPADVSRAPADVNQTPVQVGQAAAQESTTTQVAGAQATAVQTQPVNVAVPIVIASPGANTVVIQTNSASAAAQAANTAATTQVAGQSQSGGKPPAWVPQGQPPAPTGLPGSGAGTGIDLVLDSVVETGSSTYIWIWDWTWNWDWDWDWSTGGIDLPPVPGWTPPTDDANPVRPPEQAKGPRNGREDVSPGSLVAPTAPAYESLPPNPLTSASSEATRAADASSIFVQSDAEPAPGRLFLPPIGRHAAPGGSAGAGIAPLTLVVGALLALALQIFSAAGLLGRRFAVTSVGWRRQAYLTPLERPG